MNSSLQNKGAGDGQATIPQPFLHKPSFVCQLASAFLRVRGDVSYKKSSQVQIQNLTMTMRLMILRDINHQLLMMTRPPQHFDVMILGIRLLLMKLLLLMKYQTAWKTVRTEETIFLLHESLLLLLHRHVIQEISPRNSGGIIITSQFNNLQVWSTEELWTFLLTSLTQGVTQPERIESIQYPVLCSLSFSPPKEG